MKISIGEAVQVEFDTWALTEAKRHLDEIGLKYRNTSTGEADTGRIDGVMNGIFTLLLFAQLERTNKGAVERLLWSAQQLAEALSPPKAKS